MGPPPHGVQAPGRERRAQPLVPRRLARARRLRRARRHDRRSWEPAFPDPAWSSPTSGVRPRPTSPRSPAGPGTRPRDGSPLRRAIAAHFESRGVPTTPDEILVTNGAQQAIDLVGRLLVGRGEAVVLEDPTYLGAIDAFTLAGARLLPVPVGPAGTDIHALRRATQQATPALVYLVPSFHNPTGCSDAGRRAPRGGGARRGDGRPGRGGREPRRADVRRGAAAARRRLRPAGGRLHAWAR